MKVRKACFDSRPGGWRQPPTPFRILLLSAALSALLSAQTDRPSSFGGLVIGTVEGRTFFTTGRIEDLPSPLFRNRFRFTVETEFPERRPFWTAVSVGAVDEPDQPPYLEFRVPNWGFFRIIPRDADIREFLIRAVARNAAPEHLHRAAETLQQLVEIRRTAPGATEILIQQPAGAKQ